MLELDKKKVNKSLLAELTKGLKKEEIQSGDLVLSEQALAAVMFALQKGLMEQVDISNIVQEFKFKVGFNGKLYVTNPPTVKVSPEMEERVKEKFKARLVEQEGEV